MNHIEMVQMIAYDLQEARMLEEILERIGEQITWEFIKSDGRWYVWARNNDWKASNANEDLVDAVRLVALQVQREFSTGSSHAED